MKGRDTLGVCDNKLTFYELFVILSVNIYIKCFHCLHAKVVFILKYWFYRAMHIGRLIFQF